MRNERTDEHPRTSLPTPLADVVTIRQGLLVEHELVLSPGATAADIAAAMISIPPTAGLVHVRGDVTVSLVFREVPREA